MAQTDTVAKLARQRYTEKVIAAIGEKTGNRPLVCGACFGNTWDVQNHQGVIPATDGYGSMVDLNRLTASFPVAFVICQTCGYTMMFNLFNLGIAEELGIPPATD